MKKHKLKMARFDDVPRTLMSELSPRLRDYCVVLIGRRKGGHYAHCGSGTLVQVGSRRFILTAAHCAQELAKWDEIGLTVVEYPHEFVIPAESQSFIIRDNKAIEWGPDLAFISIPPSKVGTLTANKLFYNLSKNQPAMLATRPKFDQGLWAFVGAPASLTSLDNPKSIGFALTVTWAFVDRQRKRRDFDYLDVGIGMNSGLLTTNFEGVSGGSLWQVNIAEENGQWRQYGPFSLEGCAFYQTGMKDGRLQVRFHGRRSVYEHGLCMLRSAV
jgi:hypothetical protein